MTDWRSADEGSKATERDPGLARERTELSWNRSGLAVLVAVAILVRNLWPLDSVRSAVVMGAVAAGSVVWLVGMRLARRTVLRSSGGGFLRPSSGRLLTTGTLILAAAGFGVGLVLPR